MSGDTERFKTAQIDLRRSADEGTLRTVSAARCHDAAQEDDHEGEGGYYPDQLVSTDCSRPLGIVRFRERTKESRRTLQEH